MSPATAKCIRSVSSGLEYQGPNLDAYYHPSARVYYGGTATPEYQYAIRDHLGNTRVMFADKDQDGIIEETAGERPCAAVNHSSTPCKKRCPVR